MSRSTPSSGHILELLAAHHTLLLPARLEQSELTGGAWRAGGRRRREGGAWGGERRVWPRRAACFCSCGSDSSGSRLVCAITCCGGLWES